MGSALNRVLKNSAGVYVGLILMVGIIVGIVYVSGGTQSACPHLMYVPIALAAFRFNLGYSIGIAILAGLALGPWIPLNVKEGIMQAAPAWLIRVPCFIGVSVIINRLAAGLKKAAKREMKRAYEDPVTGLPNNNKLARDLAAAAQEDADMHFSLILFKFENYEFINRYIGDMSGRHAVHKLIDMAAYTFGADNIYAVSDSKFVAYLPEYTAEDAYDRGREFVRCFDKPIQASDNNVPLAINLRCGVVNYPTHAKTESEVTQMLGRSLDQAVHQGEDIVIYDNMAAKESIDIYATILTIHYAIENDMFYLVYQPKFNMRTGSICGFEALVRLSCISINPEQIVKVAEDVGLIGQITRLVIKKTVRQLKVWQDAGIKTSIAVNISTKDLKDVSLIDYATSMLMQNGVDPGRLEFEITERALIENIVSAKNWINTIKTAGIKISLDDFGTGYNSLLNLMDLPLDCIKIDKYFIDRMHEPRGKRFIRGIIALLKDLEWELVAEGVETAQQADALLAMNCGIIQGYFFSKPLKEENAAALFKTM